MEAFSDGVMAVWGILIHSCIAGSWTLFYFLLYPRIKFLSGHTVVGGVVFGLFIWTSMNYIIFPLTAVPRFPFNITGALIGAGILVCMVGIPVARSALRHYVK